MKRVIVIGAGITGLAAAYQLHETAAAREFPIDLKIFEAAPRAGGTIKTIYRDGFVIETGADSFISEKPWAFDLIRRLGLESPLIGTQEEFRKTFVVRRGKLCEIPEGFSLIAPLNLGPVFRSPIFNFFGKMRIAMEPRVKPKNHDEDESLSSFVKRRLGRQALDRLVQPLAGGIYTADPERLSITATFPKFIEFEREQGSVIRGLRVEQKKNRRTTQARGARWSLFLSLEGGMQTLVDRLVSRIGNGGIHLGTAVRSINRANDAWTVELAGGAREGADAIICTVPAFAAADLTAGAAPDLSAELRKINYSSAATVNLAWRERDFPTPPKSFGFVVPAIEKRKIIAGSFSSLKFEARAPFETILARAFLGGVLQNEMMSLDDDQMVAAARDEFRSLFGVTAQPLLTHVERMPNSMPQYEVGHMARVSRIEALEGQPPGFVLAGAYLHGVGIPDSIHSGEMAAERIFATISSR